MHHCTAVSCIRQEGKKEDINSFTIERTCPHKDTDCPEKEEYIKRCKKENK